MTAGSVLAAALFALWSQGRELSGLRADLDRARRHHERGALRPGFRGPDPPARTPSAARHHRHDARRRVRQHRVHSRSRTSSSRPSAGASAPARPARLQTFASAPRSTRLVIPPQAPRAAGEPRARSSRPAPRRVLRKAAFWSFVATVCSAGRHLDRLSDPPHPAPRRARVHPRRGRRRLFADRARPGGGPLPRRVRRARSWTEGRRARHHGARGSLALGAPAVRARRDPGSWSRSRAIYGAVERHDDDPVGPCCRRNCSDARTTAPSRG